MNGGNGAQSASATRALILANVVVFALQAVSTDGLVANFALWAIGRFRAEELNVDVGFHVWQLVTSAFLHGSLAHLLLNMFALWMFGRDVERALGGARYFVLYVAAVLSSALVQLTVVTLAGLHTPTVGASGGVFGVLLAFGVLFPRRTVVLLFPPIPMPARMLVISYAALELASGVLGTDNGVAHFAHLGGMVGAFIVLRYFRGHPREAVDEGGTPLAHI